MMLVFAVRSQPSPAPVIQPMDTVATRLHHSDYVPAENVAEKEAAFDRISLAGNRRALVKNIDAFCDCV